MNAAEARLSPDGRECSVDDCENPSRVHGLCWSHHDRQKRGRPLGPPINRRTVRPSGPSSMGWADQGACVGKPTEWWFPYGTSFPDARAVAVCAVCPVAVQCLAWALAHHEQGTWAGTTVDDRDRIRRRARRAVTA